MLFFFSSDFYLYISSYYLINLLLKVRFWGIHFQLRTVKLRLKVQEDLLGVIKLQYRPVNHNPDVKWQQKTVILYLKKRVLQLNFELQILLTVSVCNVRRRYNIAAICNHCYHNWKKNSNLFSYIYSLALKLAFALKKNQYSLLRNKNLLTISTA